MKAYTYICSALICLSVSAMAQVPDSQFAGKIPAAGETIYSEDTLTFADWNAKKPKEAQVLALFAGYQEPVTVQTKNGQRQEIKEKLMMYIAKTRMIINTPSAQIATKLPAILNLDNISKLDTEIKHKKISAADLITAQVGGGHEVTAFNWCNQQFGQIIMRPKKEISMDHLKGQKFCQASDRSICLESCYPYPSAVKATFALAGVVDKGDPKDQGTASQSELRYYVSDAEYGTPLASLTGINTQVTGVIEQNIFYFNQIFQYSKLVSVLQQHPSDSSKTVMTNFLVIGVKNRSWSKYSPVLPAVMSVGIPTYKKGMLAGVPTYSQIMTKEIAGILER